jgi:hypothetical protein
MYGNNQMPPPVYGQPQAQQSAYGYPPQSQSQPQYQQYQQPQQQYQQPQYQQQPQQPQKQNKYNAQLGSQEFPPPTDPNHRFDFTTGPKYHDVWATLLFILHFIGYIVLSALGLMHIKQYGFASSPSSNKNTNTGNEDGDPKPLPAGTGTKVIATLVLGCVVGLILSFSYTLALKRYPSPSNLMVCVVLVPR